MRQKLGYNKKTFKNRNEYVIQNKKKCVDSFFICLNCVFE